MTVQFIKQPSQRHNASMRLAREAGPRQLRPGSLRWRASELSLRRVAASTASANAASTASRLPDTAHVGRRRRGAGPSLPDAGRWSAAPAWPTLTRICPTGGSFSGTWCSTPPSPTPTTTKRTTRRCRLARGARVATCCRRHTTRANELGLGLSGVRRRPRARRLDAGQRDGASEIFGFTPPQAAAEIGRVIEVVDGWAELFAARGVTERDRESLAVHIDGEILPRQRQGFHRRGYPTAARRSGGAARLPGSAPTCPIYWTPKEAPDLPSGPWFHSLTATASSCSRAAHPAAHQRAVGRGPRSRR